MIGARLLYWTTGTLKRAMCSFQRHHQMALAQAHWAFAVGLLLYFLIVQLSLRRRDRVTYVSTYDGIGNLLGPPRSKAKCLAERAQANRRLVAAFGFTDSAFTSADPDVHHRFTSAAHQLLRHAKLQDVSVTAKKAISKFAAPAASLPFDEFVQAVTLATIFCTLFSTPDNPIHLSSLAYTDLAPLGADITRLWQHSKLAGAPLPSLLAAVHARLRVWLPAAYSDQGDTALRGTAGWSIARDADPLELLVPAFEALWRVVAVTVARCTADRRLRVRDGGIVCEVLRLHPPTRHIARVVCGRSVKADVESAQRDPAVWDVGTAADTFDPTRPQAKAGLLAFGIAPLRCVAWNWAPEAATRIAAEILEGSVKLEQGRIVGGRDGWDGWRVIGVQQNSE